MNCSSELLNSISYLPFTYNPNCDLDIYKPDIKLVCFYIALTTCIIKKRNIGMICFNCYQKTFS